MARTKEPSDGKGFTIRRLVGVYNAEGSLRGELSYWIAARFGRAHCGLCDITHGIARERSEWRSCRSGFPAPFETYHRDDQPLAVRVVTGGVLPAVVAETEVGYVLLLGPDALDKCAGSIGQFTDALQSAMNRCQVAWPS